MAQTYNRGQNFLSAVKLNYFHFVLKQLMGFTLHPAVTQSSPPKAVADLGTQTGIWAIDVAESHNVNVDAFDLSQKFVPPPEWLPHNVSFAVHDVRKPFPESLNGKYDVVHFRLFLELSPEELDMMLRNAYAILKPGGFVQWTEHDKGNLTLAAALPDSKVGAVKAFIDIQQEPFEGFDPSWVRGIAPAMIKSGLKVIVEDYVNSSKSLLLPLHELHLLSLMDVPAGLSPRLDRFKQDHFDALVSDHSNGVAVVDGFVNIVG